MSSETAGPGQPFTEEIAGWTCSVYPDPAHPGFEAICARRNRREADIGDPLEARLHFVAGPGRSVVVQHRIWVIHDPAERQRMRWGEEKFRSTDELRAWLEQTALPAALVRMLLEQVSSLPTLLASA